MPNHPVRFEHLCGPSRGTGPRRGLVPNIDYLSTKNVIQSAKVADFVRHDRDFGKEPGSKAKTLYDFWAAVPGERTF